MQAVILLVEDDMQLSAKLASILATGGYKVFAIATYGGACKIVEHYSEQLDLALVNLRLPDGWGLDLIDEIHTRCSGCVSIAMSNLFHPGIIRAARRAGVIDFLRKPLDPLQVTELVELGARRSNSWRNKLRTSKLELDPGAKKSERSRPRRGRPAGLVPVGHEIVRLRMKQGWSQDDLALRARITVRTVATAEANGRVSLATTNALANALGCELSEIVQSR